MLRMTRSIRPRMGEAGEGGADTQLWFPRGICFTYSGFLILRVITYVFICEIVGEVTCVSNEDMIVQFSDSLFDKKKVHTAHFLIPTCKSGVCLNDSMRRMFTS